MMSWRRRLRRNSSTCGRIHPTEEVCSKKTKLARNSLEQPLAKMIYSLTMLLVPIETEYSLLPAIFKMILKMPQSSRLRKIGRTMLPTAF